MNDLDYSTLSNTEMIQLLELPASYDGLRYYVPKAMKIELLEGVTDERQAEILAIAKRRQEEHHTYLRNKRAAGPIDKDASIEAKLAGAVWLYSGHSEVAGGFRDDCTGRKGKIAFVLVSETDGARLRVMRSTVDYAHSALKCIKAWPPPRGRKPAKEAAAAGVVTAAMLK